ncbi:hypothetical protein DL96DRAFT_296332 [Flagelloscypha sp. PMI_526]|nr:hypothetical protein DL96DRAFT_296332 [Flagelloscypha sp. PMI_526]
MATTPGIIRATAIRSLMNLRKHPVDNSKMRNTASLGDNSGLKNLGIHFVNLAAKTQSCETHSHDVDEEWFYILKGSEGDFVGFGAGEPTKAHSLIAGDEEMEYLCGGTRAQVDICRYPEAKKVLLINRGDQGPEGNQRWFDESALSSTPPALQKK